MKKYFFSDYEQKFIKPIKISDNEKKEIEKELVKEKREGKDNLKTFCINFIETNVLPFFKRRELTDDKRDILKYNIEKILQCCGMDKNTYRDDYYPEIIKKRKVMERKKSVEALRRFRKEFNIDKSQFNDEGIILRLEENNLDIYKTFQKMFGL